MKDMMKYVAGTLAIGMALCSSACVVLLDDEPPRCGSSEPDDYDRYEDGANWGWHGEDEGCGDGGDWANTNNDYGWNNDGSSNNDDGNNTAGGGGTNGDTNNPPPPYPDDHNNTNGGGGDGETNGPNPDDCPVEGAVCGEDGETYESACEASRAHVRVESEGPCLPPCAEDLDCADGSLCEAGSCQEVTCPDLAADDHSQEVCAEDGFTYQTSCEARMARLSVDHEGCCVE